jgi:hypothetical protein
MKQAFFRLLHPRKTQIYVIGTGKSGTHTLARIWGNQLRAAHEPEADFLLSKFLDWKSGLISDSSLRQIILEQDKRLWLEVNSSSVNFSLLDFIRDLFPKSKFILSIRNPYSWLDSFFNHQLTGSCSTNWQKMREIRFRPDANSHPEEELVLKNNNLYTLDGYLSYWKEHNTKAIASIPTDRLLIVRTDRIGQSLEELARFAGLKSTLHLLSDCHEFKARNKFNILDQLNADYLDFKIKQHCGELLTDIFPEIKSYDDVLQKKIV